MLACSCRRSVTSVADLSSVDSVENTPPFKRATEQPDPRAALRSRDQSPSGLMQPRRLTQPRLVLVTEWHRRGPQLVEELGRLRTVKVRVVMNLVYGILVHYLKSPESLLSALPQCTTTTRTHQKNKQKTPPQPLTRAESFVSIGHAKYFTRHKLTTMHSSHHKHLNYSQR